MPRRSASASGRHRPPAAPRPADARPGWAPRPAAPAAPCRPGRAGRAGPAPRRRTVAGSVGPGGQHLGDEERVAAGRARQHGAGVHAVAAASSPTAAGRQRPQRQPPHRRRGRPASDQAQSGAGAQLVVAVGEHQHARQLRDPPGQVAQHVQGGVVGPVHVLDHQHGRPAGELRPQPASNTASRSPGTQRPGQVRAGAARPSPEAGRAGGGCPGRRRPRRARGPVRPQRRAGTPRIRLDLPMPASPQTSTTEPRPCPAPLSVSRSRRNSASRSSKPAVIVHRLNQTRAQR